MKKRFLAALLCLCLAAVLLPTTALAKDSEAKIYINAAPTTPLESPHAALELGDGWYVNGENGALGTVKTSEPASWNAHFDKSKGVLYLNGFIYTEGDAPYGMYITGGDVTLELTGASEISVTGNTGGSTALGFYNYGASANLLTVQGAGSLTARAENPAGATGAGILGDLLLENGALKGEAAGTGASGVLLLGASGKLTVEGGELSGKPIENKSCYQGVYCKTLKVSGGEVNGEGGQYGICASANVRISGGEVTGASAGFGIYAYGSEIVISGGTVKGEGKKGIYTSYERGISIFGGDSLFIGEAQAVDAESLDLSGYTAPPVITVSTDKSGSPEGTYDEDAISAYKYFRITSVPVPPLALTDNATGDPAIPGTDYTYDTTNGVLRVIKAGDYTLSMAEGVQKTDHRVEVDSAQVKLTLDDVHIEGEYGSPSNSNGGPGALTIAGDVTLTLSGENSLTNGFVEISGYRAYGVFLAQGASLELTGGGSLDITVPNGAGVFLFRAKLLHIAGGNVAITAKNGAGGSDGSSGNEADFMQYQQSDGKVTITASGSTALRANTFTLSGGSLNIDGAARGAAINARYTASVSGGSLGITGSYRTGIWSDKNADDTEAGKGSISFTGGVTDITLGEGGIAIYSGYSHVIKNSTDTDPSAAPALPPHQITLGANMRVTEGGSVVWSSWLPYPETGENNAPEVVWSVYDTFSTDAATITDEGYVVFSGFSNRVRIEPQPDDRSPSYHYFTITATAGAGGVISPSGSVSVRKGADKSFSIVPEAGYSVVDVLVDGVSVGAVRAYSFTDVQKRHAIEAIFAEAAPSAGFSDVDTDDWFFEDVSFVMQTGLMQGTSDTAFAPRAPMSRAMLVTVLWRLAGQPVVNYAMEFEDVPQKQWYTEAVRWAVSERLATGYGNGYFGVADLITREQLATILYNYAKYQGCDVSGAAKLAAYTDAASISGYALTPMKWANAAGLLQGDGDRLAPGGNAQRCQVAAILHRFCETIAK